MNSSNFGSGSDPDPGLMTVQPTLVALLISGLAILLATRFLSGSLRSRDGVRPPPGPAHWLPYVGHAPQMLANYGAYLAKLAGTYAEGIFSLYLFGRQHIFVRHPRLAASLLTPDNGQPWFSTYLLLHAFGLPRKDVAAFDKIFRETDIKSASLLPENVDEITNAILRRIKLNVADFISLNSNPADQMDWERLADSDVVEENGERFMEVDLMELTRNFVANTTSVALFGTDFGENFPEFWKMLWIFDKGLFWLAMKFPSWIPWPRMQRASLARRNMLSHAYEFHAALDKHLAGDDSDPRWQDLDNVSPIILKRAELFREHGVSLKGRAAHDVALAWDMNSSTNTMIFWMLYEINRDPVLLEQIREEIAPFVGATQPENEFNLAVWVPPSIRELEVDSLLNRCRLFQSAYKETLRVYSADWSVKKMDADCTIGEDGKQGYLLKKGTYVHIPSELHNHDSQTFADPYEWKATRHIAVDEKDPKAREANVRTLGDGVVIRKSETLAAKEIAMFTAILISLYHIKAPKGGKWKSAGVRNSIPVRTPRRPVKVWVKRRDLPIEKA